MGGEIGSWSRPPKTTRYPLLRKASQHATLCSVRQRIVRYLDPSAHGFGLAALHAPIGCIQNLLITPAFFAGDGKLGFEGWKASTWRA